MSGCRRISMCECRSAGCSPPWGCCSTAYGLADGDDPAHYARSLAVNINLWWGLVMLVFGLALLAGVWLSRRRVAASRRT